MHDEEYQILSKKMTQRNADIFIAALARNKQFKEAMETPIGVELLQDTVSGIQAGVEKILDGDKSDDIRHEVKAYKKILLKWSARIVAANTGQAQFNKLTKGV